MTQGLKINVETVLEPQNWIELDVAKHAR